MNRLRREVESLLDARGAGDDLAEKVGDSSYAGILEGRDLDVIHKVGWDAESGTPVAAIAAPIPDDPNARRCVSS